MMITFENRSTQFVKLLLARLILIAFAKTVAVMMSKFLDVGRITDRRVNALRSAQLTHHFIALLIVNQLLDRYHARILPQRLLPHLLEIR
jgi:hypothetical protein